MPAIEWWVLRKDPALTTDVCGPFDTEAEAIAWRDKYAAGSEVHDLPAKRRPRPVARQ